jgi:hypothetical protein
MSTFLRRGFTLFLLLLAAAFLHPVDTTAQTLPGWAEPSEQQGRSEVGGRSSDSPWSEDRRNQDRRVRNNPEFDLEPFRASNQGLGGAITNNPPTNCTTNDDCSENQVCCNVGGALRCKGAQGCESSGGTPVPLPPLATVALSLIGLAYGTWRLRCSHIGSKIVKRS